MLLTDRKPEGQLLGTDITVKYGPLIRFVEVLFHDPS